MVARLELAIKANKITNPPKWIGDNLHYEVIMGSHAYGVSTDSSDMDIYGWCIPPKELMFPHLAGYIEGFGHKPHVFTNFQQHHVFVNTDEYDFTIYSIAKYLDLILSNNPNMIDSLFVPYNCVTKMTATGSIVRDARKTFLHKGAYSKFKGYAYAQLHKLKGKSANSSNPERKATVEQFGYDVKFAYHLVRLLNECEQILTEGDINLQRDNEQLKAVRRGEWSEEYLLQWAAEKEIQLGTMFANSRLRPVPDLHAAKALLLAVLEQQYGSISSAVVVLETKEDTILSELQQLIDKHKRK